MCVDHYFGSGEVVYAPNISSARAHLWEWIASLPDAKCIICGDFNMVEWEGDQVGGLGSVVCGL